MRDGLFQARDALHDYYSNMQHMLVRRAWTHWNALHTDDIFSPLLQQHLRQAYRAYSPYTDTNAHVVGPWLPEKASFFRSKVIEGDRTTALSKPLTVRRPQTAVPYPGRRRATNIQPRPKSAATRLTLSYPSPVPCSPYTAPPYKPGQCWN